MYAHFYLGRIASRNPCQFLIRVGERAKKLGLLGLLQTRPRKVLHFPKLLFKVPNKARNPPLTFTSLFLRVGLVSLCLEDLLFGGEGSHFPGILELGAQDSGLLLFQEFSRCVQQQQSSLVVLLRSVPNCLLQVRLKTLVASMLA